ncbi:MAG: hypothetical protein HC895_03085 [Leptolyngbyaceae cyanobacterium SM1_3_5]|nr:hypothetical protein [Leptolyngbyaceae cyanobacterium SM1_3_5]
MLKVASRLIALLLSSAIALPAAADDFFLPGMSPMEIAAPWNAGESARIQGLAMQAQFSGEESRPSPSSATRPDNRPDAATTAQGTVDLSYPPSDAVKQQVERNYLDRLRQTHPEAANQLAAQLRQSDYRDVFTNLVQPYGLSGNNLADIVTAYSILNWMIANQSANNPSRQAVLAERDQTAATLSQIASLNDTQQRQQVGEEIKLLFVTLHSGWQAAQREGTLSQYSDGVTTLFRQQSGIDPRQIVLTEAGFQPRN